MTFLSGQDDFFQTANQPISVRHLSEPYNNINYIIITNYIDYMINYIINYQ